jgi:hypothetical protein
LNFFTSLFRATGQTSNSFNILLGHPNALFQ